MRTHTKPKAETAPATRKDNADSSERAERIEQLRAQILAGTYRISAEAVAEKLVEHMRTAHDTRDGKGPDAAKRDS